jgi:acyl-CoA reductase-like NAD-dependent aldehyde dehydrogenase
VARLNDTPFGLAASVWTSDIARAHQMAAEIQAGAVWVNCINMLDDGAPMGGFKQSGWGYEGGRLGVEEFTQVKTVAIDLS